MILRPLVLSILACTLSFGADWNHFRGPGGDGICPEKGLLQSWPKEGPKLLWQMKGLGKGFGSLAIVGGKLFAVGDRGDSQYLIAFDLSSQKELWSTKLGKNWGDGGSRCTPTVDGDLVYATTPHGDLVCAQASDGKETWRKGFGKDFGGKMMSGWGFSESVLIDADKLVCTPGGNDAVIVALNKKTGETIWKSALGNAGSRGKDGAGYSSLVISEAAGVRQYLQIMGRGCVSVAAADGKFLWCYNKIANNVANISMPVVQDNLVFVSTAYGTGSALLELSKDGDGVKVTEKYFLGADTFQNHHGGVVRVGDYLFGGAGQNAGAPVCIEMKTGKILWKDKAPAKGSAAVLYYDNRLIFRYDSGLVALIEPSPEKFNLVSSFTPPVKEGPQWSHPVILDGKLYLRSHDVLMCYEVK